MRPREADNSGSQVRRAVLSCTPESNFLYPSVLSLASRSAACGDVSTLVSELVQGVAVPSDTIFPLPLWNRLLLISLEYSDDRDSSKFNNI